MTTLGLIGLGRIGAFHAETLSALPSVTSLVVTDAVAAAIQPVVDKHGVEAAASARGTAGRGRRRRGGGRGHRRPPGAHPRRGRRRGAGVLREAGGQNHGRGRSGRPPGRRPRRAHPDRLSAPLRQGFAAVRKAIAEGELGWVHTVRSTTLDPAPPPAAYLAVSGGIFRDCSIHDFDAVRWVTGQEVVEVYATGSDRGEPRLRRHRRRGLRPQPCSPSPTAPARWCQEQPLQRPWPRRAHGGARLGGQRRGRRRRAGRWAASRGVTRSRAAAVPGSSWTVSGRVPRESRRSPSGRGRALGLHGRGRAGDRLDRRGLRQVAERSTARCASRRYGSDEHGDH